MKKFIFGLILSLIGCSTRVPDEVVPELSVFGILVLDEPTQKIYVEKIEALKQKNFENITIKVKQDTNTIYFYPHPETSNLFIDTTALKWLKPLKTYILTVYLNETDSLYSSTQMPSRFTIQSPPDSSNIYLDDSTTTLVEWQHSEGARIYMLNFFFPEDSTSLSFPAQDTLVDLFYYKSYFKSQGLCILKINALDENTYQWEINGISSIEKGEGVWGTIAIDSVVLYLK